MTFKGAAVCSYHGVMRTEGLGIEGPWPVFIEAYANAAATGLIAYLRLLQHTCRIDIVGEHPLRLGRPVIITYWHEFVIAGFVMVLEAERPLACLCHPAWHLSPWVELGRRHQWHVVLGSTGHRGRAASEEVISLLRQGWSTCIFPDGPAGPPRVAHHGVVHMAQRSGAPIVPVRFECDLAVRLPSWDHMRAPIPGSTIRAIVGAPIEVHDVDEALRTLEGALG